MISGDYRRGDHAPRDHAPDLQKILWDLAAA